jgi:transcriptional regulator with XRE-family HTH domain
MPEPANGFTFRSAHARLLAQVRTRMQNGELTERALARRLGVSQSHINNVLRGRRNLSQELADSILKFLKYSLLDLHYDLELQACVGDHAARMDRMEIDVLQDPIGGGNKWSTLRDSRIRYQCPLSLRGVPNYAYFCRLARDPRMTEILFGRDMVLIDPSLTARLTDSPTSIYLVQIGSEAVLRWVRGGFRNLYVADEITLDRPVDWERIPIREDQRLDVIKGRAIWIGNEAALR